VRFGDIVQKKVSGLWLRVWSLHVCSGDVFETVFPDLWSRVWSSPVRFGDVFEKVVPSTLHHRLASSPVYAQNPCNIVPSNAGGRVEPNTVTSLLEGPSSETKIPPASSFLLTKCEILSN